MIIVSIDKFFNYRKLIYLYGNNNFSFHAFLLCIIFSYSNFRFLQLPLNLIFNSMAFHYLAVSYVMPTNKLIIARPFKTTITQFAMPSQRSSQPNINSQPLVLTLRLFGAIIHNSKNKRTKRQQNCQSFFYLHSFSQSVR